MKKNIWIMNHYASHLGGRHYEFAQELSKRGYNISVICSSYSHTEKPYIMDLKKKYEIKVVNNIKYVYIKTNEYEKNDIKRIKNMASYAFKSIFIKTKEVNKPDVIVASSVHPLTWISGYILSKLYKAKFISEVRDLWPETLIEMGLCREDSLKVKLLYRLEKFIYKKSETVISTFPKFGEYLKEKNINNINWIWISNGVNLSEFKKNIKKYNYEDYFKLDSSKFNVIYTGAHGIPNSLDNILDCANILKDNEKIVFNLVGSGCEKNRLIDRAKNEDITNINFFDSIPKNYVPSLLTNSDLQIVISANTPNLFRFGISFNKLFEYMASEKPTVFIGDVGNDIIGESKSGISSKSRNPEDLANYILKIYNMDDLEKKNMGKCGYSYVANNFDIPILVDKLESIL